MITITISAKTLILVADIVALVTYVGLLERKKIRRWYR